ncbi:hypothetical protein [uncultured Mediterranea sp.]|uniref:hypothetical protein n=1 Tax=uncultured Mediterranea sp. TaxID=1926662 RepID=UPI002588B80A|nr:hypothetical protein [uncultured Mediterranea sp.]
MFFISKPPFTFTKYKDTILNGKTIPLRKGITKRKQIIRFTDKPFFQKSQGEKGKGKQQEAKTEKADFLATKRPFPVGKT